MRLSCELLESRENPSPGGPGFFDGPVPLPDAPPLPPPPIILPITLFPGW